MRIKRSRKGAGAGRQRLEKYVVDGSELPEGWKCKRIETKNVEKLNIKPTPVGHIAVQYITPSTLKRAESVGVTIYEFKSSNDAKKAMCTVIKRHKDAVRLHLPLPFRHTLMRKKRITMGVNEVNEAFGMWWMAMPPFKPGAIIIRKDNFCIATYGPVYKKAEVLVRIQLQKMKIVSSELKHS